MDGLSHVEARIETEWPTALMPTKPEYELFYSRSYRFTEAMVFGALSGISVVLLVCSFLTKKPELAVAYRWVAVFPPVIFIPLALYRWRVISRTPALQATHEGLLLANGRLLEWSLFSKALVVKVQGMEWVGFRFRSGEFKKLDDECKGALRKQDGWIMIRLACAVPTESVTVGRDRLLGDLASLSRLPIAESRNEIDF